MVMVWPKQSFGVDGIGPAEAGEGNLALEHGLDARGVFAELARPGPAVEQDVARSDAGHADRVGGISA